uniref:Phosphoribosyl pyrophosphate synthase-associated protein 2 n=1 Tax=Mus spicilegus TaxID=10103 RepID=A0A8C6H4R8_MUSSI
MNITKGGLVLFSANSNSSYMKFSKKIAEQLGEPNRETKVQIQESVREKDVFIIQTISKDVNTTIMELLIMVYACKTSCAKSIIGVIPYFPYSKKCKMKKKGGFFNIPVDNLRASPFLLQYIQEEIQDYRNAVIVAKSPASAKRAQSFVTCLCLGMSVIHGEAQDAESDLVDGRHSPPIFRSVAAIHHSLEISMGAYKIFVMATHGFLSSDATRLIEESAIDEVVVTNTIPQEIQKLQCPKIKTVDISMILSKAIRQIHNGESMSNLFRNIGLDD